VILGVWLSLLGCDGRAPSVDASSAGTPVMLDRAPFAELALPPDSRDGVEPPDTVAITGPWELLSATDRQRRYRAPLPIRPRAMFFAKPPTGMRVMSGERLVGIASPKHLGYSFDARTITATVGLAEGAPADWTVSYPMATQRERSLNYAFSGVETPEAFARTNVQVGNTSMDGRLLPAPAHAAWDVAVPAAGELWFRVGLVPPETADGAPSDGATASVEVEEAGATSVVWSRSLAAGSPFEDVIVDLSAYAGRTVRLRLRTEPGETSRFDYVFFGEPVVASHKSDPKRIVFVFADTVRRDHLGLYGYARDTSTPLDAWAANATVFDDARSTAPWTLPAARSLFTGRQPEEWEVATTLQRQLRDRGFATAAFEANVYLSSNFDMQRDFGMHECERTNGTVEVDRALAWLDAHEGRDSFLIVHLMDAHLPYKEPAAYRYRYTTPGQAGEATLAESFERAQVARQRNPTPELRQYVTDRYDQNLAYAHDEVGRLLRNLDDDDVVVYFSDHGEELWDHNGFEHGHTLYDELLRIPLVIKAPGVPPGRVDGPVSLLDVTPTVLDLLALPHEGLDGVSLAPSMRGEAGATAALDARDLGFGRPLYGAERWGVLHAGQKYTTTEGRESLFDLTVDPNERDDLLTLKADPDGAPGRPILGGALEREVALG
jgi:arylsulfatase A-like enzyme